MLSVNPIAHISAKVPMIDTGMASAAMIVLRQLPRKMSTITAAKNAPRTRCSLTALTLVRIEADSSRTTFSSQPGGSDFCTSPSRALTASTTATVFSPDCLRIDRTTLSLPSSEAEVLGSSTPSSTRATSPMRVGWSWLSLMTMRPIFATSSTRPSTRSERLFGPVSICPPGTLRFCCASARSTSTAVSPTACELERVEPDVDLPLLAPEDVDLTDAVDALDLAAHPLVGELGRVADRPGAAQRDVEDRRGVGVDLRHDGLVDPLGEVGQDVVDVVAHLLRGDVGVLVEVEGDDDQRDALARRRAQLVDAADRVDGPLDLVGQLRLDLLRRRAVLGRRHDDGGEIDLGELVDPQREVAEGADHDEDQHQHPGEDRLPDAERREPLHASTLAFATRSCAPSAAPGGGETTTCSPFFTPSAMATMSPTLGPSCTTRSSRCPSTTANTLSFSLVVDERLRGHDRQGHLADRELRRDEHARQERVVVVVGHGLDDEIARGLADLPAHVLHGRGEDAPRERHGLERDGEPRVHAADVGLGDGELEAQRVVDQEGDDARVGVHVVADVDEALGDDAAERGADGRVGERLRGLGGAHARGLLARGLGLAARRLLVVLLLGDGPLGEQADVALAVGPDVLELLGGARHVGLGLGARQSGRARVELGEECPLGDVVAALDERPDHAAGGVGGQVRALVRRRARPSGAGASGPAARRRPRSSTWTFVRAAGFTSALAAASCEQPAVEDAEARAAARQRRTERARFIAWPRVWRRGADVPSTSWPASSRSARRA